MSLLEQIKADSLTARKNRQALAATLLTTLYSEAVNVGKNKGNRLTTDAETVAVVKKFIDGADTTIGYLDNSPDSDEALRTVKAEKAILLPYLPKQLSEDDLNAAITLMVSLLSDKSPKQMGGIMKALKDQFEGQYDGNVASRLVKAALAS